MLSEFLKNEKMTGEAFAQMCGLKQYEISRIVSGRRKASVRIAKAIELHTNKKITCADLRPDIFGEAA